LEVIIVSNATKLTVEDSLRVAARIYLADLAYGVLLGQEEPAKTGEVLRDIGVEDFTLRLIRQILGADPRFEQIDRRWTLSSRLQDKQRTFERVIETILRSYGKPMPVSTVAQEVGIVYERPAAAYTEMLPRLLDKSDKFFRVKDDKYGLIDWIVIAEGDEPEDVMFFNGISEGDLHPYRKAAKVQWDAENPAPSVEKLVKNAGGRIPLRFAAYLAWEAMRADYDAFRFYESIISSDSLDVLSSQDVINEDYKKSLISALVEIDSELEEITSEAGEGLAEAVPVTITDDDRDEIVEYINKHGGAVRADEIIESIIEISPGERGYEAALESLHEALKDENRITKVGEDIWVPAGSLPDFINEIPEVLIIPAHTPYETPEGEMFDQELEDEGLDPGLRQEILNPLVQDIGDEDPDKTAYQPLDTYQRCALKYHHKEAGTMPLIQFNPGFFGSEPEIVQITLVSEGIRRDAWVNNKTRLIYGLKDWFTTDMPVSGAAFEIHRTERHGEYRFVYEGRTDPQVFVPAGRVMELLKLKEEAEEQSYMPLFEIITRILEHYRKGIGFVPLFTEVNLVRRCTRRLVASILSSYHCFHTRGKTGEWQYDAKKRSQGFNKAKRKYILK
jgi:hypothetical protein